MEPRVKFVLPLFSLALLTTVFVPALHADTIYNSISGGVCPDPTVCGLPISGENTGNEASAVAFTPSANYTVTGAAAVLLNTFEDTTVNFFIYSNSGNFPDASLGELGSVSIGAGDEGTYTVNASTPISLDAGTQYWLVLTAGDNLTAVEWEEFALVQQPFAYTADGSDPGGWMTTPIPTAFAQLAIYGTPTVTTPPAATPEPASALLLFTAFGFGGLMYSKRLNWAR